MNYYHIWCNLVDSHKDLEFCEAVSHYLGYLKGRGLLSGFKIARRKFGFGPSELGEFHIVIETESLETLDKAFSVVAIRHGEIESLHKAVYAAVRDFKSALYRDFPDEGRVK